VALKAPRLRMLKDEDGEGMLAGLSKAEAELTGWL
jgi:hypothetical protein